jgi:hypothetical protein
VVVVMLIVIVIVVLFFYNLMRSIACWGSYKLRFTFHDMVYVIGSIKHCMVVSPMRNQNQNEIHNPFGGQNMIYATKMKIFQV